MTHIAGFERNQLLLLPEAVDDYVDADNPVRSIDAFVDGLDLATAGFARVAAKAASGLCAGRPAEALCLWRTANDRFATPSASGRCLRIPAGWSRRILLKNPRFWREHLGFVAMSARQIPALRLMWRRWASGSE